MVSGLVLGTQSRARDYVPFTPVSSLRGDNGGDRGRIAVGNALTADNDRSLSTCDVALAAGDDGGLAAGSIALRSSVNRPRMSMTFEVIVSMTSRISWLFRSR